MADLKLKYQGIKGGEPIWKNRVGYISAFFNNIKIIIDNYQGFGNSYKKREEPIIDIQEDGKMIFSGTIKELKDKLK